MYINHSPFAQHNLLVKEYSQNKKVSNLILINKTDRAAIPTIHSLNMAQYVHK